MSYKWVDCT